MANYRESMKKKYVQKKLLENKFRFNGFKLKLNND